MNDRILALITVLAVIFAARYAPLILPVAATAIGGTVLVLSERIVTTVLHTGWRYVPARKARA